MAKPEQWHTEQELTEGFRGMVIDRIVTKPEANEFTIWFTDPRSRRAVSLVFFIEEGCQLGYAEVGPDGL